MSRRSQLHRLAVATHVGFVRMTGRSLGAFERLPSSLLAQIRRELGIDTPDLVSLRALYARRPTLFEHQRWAADLAGFNVLTDGRRRVLVHQLRKEAGQELSPARLVQFARQWLYAQKILIPAERTLLGMARRACAAHEKALIASIENTIPGDTRANWFKALFTERPPHGTALQWLQRHPRRRSPKTADEVMAKIVFLKELGVAVYPLTEIMLDQQRAYARHVRRRRPSKWAEIKEPRRTLEMVCFLRVPLAQLTDVHLSLTDMRGAAVFRRATDQVIRQRMTSSDAFRLLREIRRLADDTQLGADELRKSLLEMVPAELGNGKLAATVREKLSRSARQTRPLLKSIFKLELRTVPGSPLEHAMLTLRRSYEENRTSLESGVDAAFAQRWENIIHGKDRKQAMRGFEAAMIQELRKGLRNGSVWVDDSLRYRDRDAIFMASSTWEETRKRHYKRLKLPRSAPRHLAPLLSSIDAGLAALAEAVTDKVVSIDDELHLPALKAESTDGGLARVRDKLSRDVGEIQLPDLIVEMDSKVRFSWELMGRPARSEDELLATYAALLAHGTGLESDSAAMMMPGISSHAITSAMHDLQHEDVLTKANALIVEFLHDQPLAKLWGSGTMASSDAMSLEASRHLWNARIDPRHRRHAVGMYTHVLDKWGIIYDQPLILGERQAGAAIEGMMRQTASVELEQLAVDTHGYTDFAMGLSKLLGFELCPRLKNLRHRRLHLPRSVVVPKVLDPIVERDVDLDVIAKGWDGLVRVAASIESGVTPATIALQRFGAASRGDPIYDAGVALGKLRRSLFLTDFSTNPTFRRELLRVLNYGESVHALQRVIHPGKIPLSRGRHPEDLAAISGSLSLLSNLVMAWTAVRMQAVLDDRRGNGAPLPSDAVLRHIAPVHFGGVNFRGRYHFPVGRYSQQLIVPQGIKSARR